MRQIVDGVLVAVPRPALEHTVVTSALMSDLGAPFSRGRGGPGGWIFLTEPELHFGDDVLVPDLAAWWKKRLPVLPPAGTPWLSLALDWICELLSPSTARLDKVQKRRIDAREPVAFLWYATRSSAC